jgi:hypothetical protein
MKGNKLFVMKAHNEQMPDYRLFLSFQSPERERSLWNNTEGRRDYNGDISRIARCFQCREDTSHGEYNILTRLLSSTLGKTTMIDTHQTKEEEGGYLIILDDRELPTDPPPAPLTSLPSDPDCLVALTHAIQKFQVLCASAYVRLSDVQQYSDSDITIALLHYEARLHCQIETMRRQLEELRQTDWQKAHALLCQLAIEDSGQYTLENVLHLIFQRLYQPRSSTKQAS